MSRGHEAHGHSPANFGRAFAVGVLLNGGYVAVEALFGVAAHSMALLADAGHNLGDVLGLLMAWAAMLAAEAKPSTTHTYGLRKTPVLAALANATLLMGATGAIAYESVRRLAAPGPVHGALVVWVALAGLAVNGGTALLFMAGRREDLNVRAAFLHMAADAAIVLGIAVSGGIVLATGWTVVDPIVSLLVCAGIAWGTWKLLREATDMALDAVPPGISLEKVRHYLAGLPGVVEVHDLHVWSMSTTEKALTVHLVMPGLPADDEFLARANRDLRDRFGIEHTTVQVESGDPHHPCGQAADHSL